MSNIAPVPKSSLPPLKIMPGGSDVDVSEAVLQSIQPSPGYPHAIVLLADAITKRCDRLLMDFLTGGVNVRYEVDGIWQTMPAIPRDIGDYMLASLKQVAMLDYRERRQKQEGDFVAEYLRVKHKCRLTSQGIEAGERVLISISRKRPPLEKLEDIGMRPGMRKELLDALNSAGGLVLFSSLPGDGLSTTWRAALQSTDRFLRDYYTMQEKSRQEPEIINVTPEVWDESKGETMLSAMRSLLLREPNAIAFPEIGSAENLNEMCRLAATAEVSIATRIHARHAVEAVVRALLFKPDIDLFVSALELVVCQRVVRKLCPGCKQAFTPHPQMLAQLGLPPERVNVLYRHFQLRPEDLVDERGNPREVVPCEQCGGLGYLERTGVFELLRIDDRFREVLKTSPTVGALNQAAHQSGHISLKDEGVLLVARGETSLEELQRVLSK